MVSSTASHNKMNYIEFVKHISCNFVFTLYIFTLDTWLLFTKMLPPQWMLKETIFFKKNSGSQFKSLNFFLLFWGIIASDPIPVQKNFSFQQFK